MSIAPVRHAQLRTRTLMRAAALVAAFGGPNGFAMLPTAVHAAAMAPASRTAPIERTSFPEPASSTGAIPFAFQATAVEPASHADTIEPARTETATREAAAGPASRTTVSAGVRPVTIPPGHLERPARDAQTALVRTYLSALERGDFVRAFSLLNGSARAYFRDADNYRSIFDADGYRLERFTLLGMRGAAAGRVYFVRESARFRDYARDAELALSATVPIGVVFDAGVPRIKDPGHPWRADAVAAAGDANGVRVEVKKISFFERRIELTVTFANLGSRAVTLLPYDKSIVHDAAGTPYRIIETRDWSLTDKTLFEGVRLPSSGQITGILGFVSPALASADRIFTLTVAPLILDGGDAPFEIRVDGIGRGASVGVASKRR